MPSWARRVHRRIVNYGLVMIWRGIKLEPASDESSPTRSSSSTVFKAGSSKSLAFLFQSKDVMIPEFPSNSEKWGTRQKSSVLRLAMSFEKKVLRKQFTDVFIAGTAKEREPVCCNGSVVTKCKRYALKYNSFDRLIKAIRVATRSYTTIRCSGYVCIIDRIVLRRSGLHRLKEH